MNKLRQWFESLKERERRMVVIGAVAVGVLILAGGVLLPLQSALSTAVSRRDAKLEDLAWMQLHATEVRAGGGLLPQDTGEPPVVLVDRVGHEAGLADSLRGNARATLWSRD